MNPLEVILIIVAIVVLGNVLKSRHQGRRRDRDESMNEVPADANDAGETRRLRDELTQLKQRIQVLERIAVEKENSLEREIEQLRDR